MNYFTRKEVTLHHSPDDAWVVVFNRVYNVTPLIEKYGPEAPEIKPLLMFAGKDVSHWFDGETEDFIYYLDIQSGISLPFSMHEVPPQVEDSSVETVEWWRGEELRVGVITKQARQVRIINTLIGSSTTIECCDEDLFHKIKERYSALGYDISNEAYTWISFLTGEELDPDLTLEQNGLPDESKHFEELCMPVDYHTPSVLLFYNDIITPPLPLQLDPDLNLSFDIQ